MPVLLSNQETARPVRVIISWRISGETPSDILYLIWPAAMSVFGAVAVAVGASRVGVSVFVGELVAVSEGSALVSVAVGMGIVGAGVGFGSPQAASMKAPSAVGPNLYRNFLLVVSSFSPIIEGLLH